MYRVGGRLSWSVLRSTRASSVIPRHYTTQPSSGTTDRTEWSIAKALDETAHVLPHQGILENFVHHNPLEHYQHLPFNDAIKRVQIEESSTTPSERLNQLLHVDPRKQVNEALVVLSSSFLDRGAAKWVPRYRDKGFLHFFAVHEGNRGPEWRSFARKAAAEILKSDLEPAQLAEKYLVDYLDFFKIQPEYRTAALRALLLELRGWAGMFRRMETHPVEAPVGAKVRLADFCAVQAILSRSSIEDMCQDAGWDARVLFSEWLSQRQMYLPHTRLESGFHPSSLALLEHRDENRELLEFQFEQQLLDTLRQVQPQPMSDRPTMQIFTCIDDREGSMRRHIESQDPTIETFGVAGFFGLPIRYISATGLDPMILAPEGRKPTATLIEKHPNNDEVYISRARIQAEVNYWWERASFHPLLSFGQSLLFLPVSLSRLILLGLMPALKNQIETAAHQAVVPALPTDFAQPHSDAEAAALLAQTFRDIGIHKQFAPLVAILGHGSTSTNNPFEAAYQCGACGGRNGGPNARLMARYGNDPEDTIQYFDTEQLEGNPNFAEVKRVLETAGGENALERCQRFLMADGVDTPAEALRHVHRRATEAAEIRPELNHAGNAAVIVGRRSLTKGAFLDRRGFLCSYDPDSDDEAGTNLEHVLSPALQVCSGINLEYLFSTVQPDHQGAGTKAPLNIVGNIGVLQGTLGDLRPGLPSQMTEMHTPIRALFIVDAPTSRVEAVLSRKPQLADLVYNEWVRMMVRDPTTQELRKYVPGHGFVPVVLPERPIVKPEREWHEMDPFAETQYGESHNEELPDSPALFRTRNHGLSVVRKEAFIYWSSVAGMLAATALPIYYLGADAMNPRGVEIALAGAALSLPVMAYSRRYLHGEFMYGRFSLLSTGLLLGFNLVALAPDLEMALPAWSLFGFSSAFLIGSYNTRPTVRNNATFAFSAYKVSDLALLTAATFAPHSLDVVDPRVAAGILVAALLKSSQWPLIGLFARSMEGPTPASALGYAGLSAHIGMILLTSTAPMWMPLEWARVSLGVIGGISALYGTLEGNIRPDRKGAVANATSATIGTGCLALALGYPDIALLLSLGHAAFRMRQILLSSNILSETREMRAGLRANPWPKVVPDWLYRAAWRIRRLDDDWNGAFVQTIHKMSGPLHLTHPPHWTRPRRWLTTAAAVVLAGAPFTPISYSFENLLMELLHTHPALATTLMVAHFGTSVVIFRFLLMNVLQSPRFAKQKEKIL